MADSVSHQNRDLISANFSLCAIFSFVVVDNTVFNSIFFHSIYQLCQTQLTKQRKQQIRKLPDNSNSIILYKMYLLYIFPSYPLLQIARNMKYVI